jgi:hypothetical protein
MSVCLTPGLSSAYWHIRRRSSSVSVRRGVLPPVVVCLICSEWELDDTADDGVVVDAVGRVGVEKLDWDVNMLGHGGTINGWSGCNC